MTNTISQSINQVLFQTENVHSNYVIIIIKVIIIEVPLQLQHFVYFNILYLRELSTEGLKNNKSNKSSKQW